MSSDLTALISSIQAQLIDDGTRFTTATCTAAIREALKDLNVRAPLMKETLITPVAGTLEYEVTGADADAFRVDSIYQRDPADETRDLPIFYDDYWRDEKLFIRLRAEMPTAYQILANYAKPHTVNGLDSKTTSTLSGFGEQILIDGACFHALNFRAAGRVEANNLNTQTPAEYQRISSHFQNAFNSGLDLLARRRGAVGTPSTAAWNDDWHNWLR
jgi:hypothetical protein